MLAARELIVGEVTIILLILLLPLAACESADFLYTKDGKIECGGDGEAIKLVNNPRAADPSFAELAAFIKADPTDAREYIEDGLNAFVCSDFAEEVHNNAEAAGIRAGWAGIQFASMEEGHAVNAFETTDKGLVYIDCTNGRSPEGDTEDAPGWDTVAYIETGKRYGILHIDRVASAPYDYYAFRYDFYLDCEKARLEYEVLLNMYNEEVNDYNREVEGKVYTIGSAEEKRITTWKERLDQQGEYLNQMEEELGKYWYESEFSSLIVEDVYIHWQ
jgi:hypothetical protein